MSFELFYTLADDEKACAWRGGFIIVSPSNPPKWVHPGDYGELVIEIIKAADIPHDAIYSTTPWRIGP